VARIQVRNTVASYENFSIAETKYFLILVTGLFSAVTELNSSSSVTTIASNWHRSSRSGEPT